MVAERWFGSYMHDQSVRAPNRALICGIGFRSGARTSLPPAMDAARHSLALQVYESRNT